MTNDRRWGIAVVVAAALALIVVNRVSGRNVHGEPVALPWTPPPAVGACLVVPDLGATSTEPSEVPCSEPHTAEVVESWRAGAESPSGAAAGADRCSSQGPTMTGTSGPDWTAPQPWLLSRPVSGGAPLGWQACVVGPVTSGPQLRALQYAGSVNPLPGGESSAAVGACYRDELQQVDCTTPHFVQRIGTFQPEYLARTPVTGCLDFAVDQVGAAAFGGAHPLQAKVSQDPSMGSMVLQDDGSRQLVPMQTCEVSSAEPGRELVGSVIGLGDRPIPYG
ncbi:hypothetical protein [Nakamurella lactea]|uniref:hypothetical protein n=1 Tax=Nakamurella lactea TaxID=459515 RepID=UPI000425A3BF|nr:hypothetical protein [Nakamurella lactea]